MKIKKRNPKRREKASNLKEWMYNMRGIEDDIESFFFPNKDNMNSPFDIKNMDKAVEMASNAVYNKLKIYVYSDPDSDGCTSCSIGYSYFNELTDNIDYIYHQRNEGHGVIVDKVPDDCDLLIIVDSSTNSVEECKILSERCDILIIDHHPSDVKNPYATIVNCTMHNYSNPNLSGSAMVYKLCKAYDETYGLNNADKYIDLACVGMVGDMMSVAVLENRYIINEGLNLIESKKGNLGLKALYELVLNSKKLESADIGYYIAPCINAVIRMSDISKVLKLLTSTDESECNLLAEEIIEINNDRKQLTSDIFEYIQSQGIIDDSNKVIIIDMSESNYSSNIFGLVANKVAQEYGKPCLFGKVHDGTFYGSMRSVGYEVKLRRDINNSGLFLWCRGHESSAGVSFNIANLDDINSYFNNKYARFFKEKTYSYDAVLNYNKMTFDFLDRLESVCRITGMGFGKPKFLLENFKPQWYNKMGKDDNHIKLVKRDIEDGYFNVMEFNTKSDIKEYEKADSLSVIGSIGVNRYYSEKKQREFISKQMFSDIIICK